MLSLSAHDQLCAWLEKETLCEIDILVEDANGDNLLHLFLKNESQVNKFKRLNLLIELGVDVNKLNHDNETPMDYYFRYNLVNDKVVHVLLDYGAFAITGTKYIESYDLPIYTCVLDQRKRCKAIARIVLAKNILGNRDMSRLLAKYIFHTRTIEEWINKINP